MVDWRARGAHEPSLAFRTGVFALLTLAGLFTLARPASAAERYPAGLKIGSFVKVDTPFAPEAYRFENGRLMAGPGCTFIPGCD